MLNRATFLLLKAHHSSGHEGQRSHRRRPLINNAEAGQSTSSGQAYINGNSKPQTAKPTCFFQFTWCPTYQNHLAAEYEPYWMLSAAMGTTPDLLLQIYLELNTVVRKVVHICNPRPWRLRQECKKVKTRINYMVATNFKRKIKIKTIWENCTKQCSLSHRI